MEVGAMDKYGNTDTLAFLLMNQSWPGENPFSILKLNLWPTQHSLLSIDSIQWKRIWSLHSVHTLLRHDDHHDPNHYYFMTLDNLQRTTSFVHCTIILHVFSFLCNVACTVIYFLFSRFWTLRAIPLVICFYTLFNTCVILFITFFSDGNKRISTDSKSSSS